MIRRTLRIPAARKVTGPYRTYIATVGTREIPWAWVEQTRVGGRIVAPLNGGWYPPGLVVLNRTEQAVTGRLAGPADFMRMRSQARSRAVPDGIDPVAEHTGTIAVHPYYLTADRNAAVAIDQRTTDIRFAWHSPDNTGAGVLWLYGPRSWAKISTTGGQPYEVEQSGPRRLVDEVLAAHRWWRNAGEPRVQDWLVTVTPQGQTIELT